MTEIKPFKDSIHIKKSNTADTRTCDWSLVTEEDLIKSTKSHILDVQLAIQCLAQEMTRRAAIHDWTKLKHIDQFHSDFKTGFKTQEWYEMHKRTERHHISAPEGIRDDIDLLDVIEFVCDCVCAGMARSGSVYDLKVDSDVLQRALKNTVEKLKASVKVLE